MVTEKKFFRICALVLFASLALAPLPAQDFSNIELETVKVTDNISLLAGGGGNIGVLTGKDGVLVVDTSFSELYDKVMAAIRKSCDKPVTFVILTHQHYDHVSGNADFAGAGALICAHENVRKGMKTEWEYPGLAKIPPYSERALPVLTYSDSITFHFNDEEFKASYLGPGHTTGDTIIHFVRANVIHLGDLYFNGGYPFIDVLHGGRIDGIIRILRQIVEEINDDTKVIPGHGPLSNRKELRSYLSMLSTVRDRIETLIREGKTLEQVIAAKPTSDFDRTPQVMMPPDFFVKLVYEDLSRK